MNFFHSLPRKVLKTNLIMATLFNSITIATSSDESLNANYILTSKGVSSLKNQHLMVAGVEVGIS